MDHPIKIVDLNNIEIEEILLNGDLSELEDEGCDGDEGITEADDALIEAAMAGAYDGDEEDDTSATVEIGQGTQYNENQSLQNNQILPPALGIIQKEHGGGVEKTSMAKYQ
ncbi:hypothetical protein LSTR_LSTR001558 [Laodelphax striatellus]|uniref:Uncharacterized protein n=1 Tax=Laodelphax striatellus TaxID=195883 RepID=A0A482XC87_LAOST|nr:hypothetical protein LSTR_LSTR001558 [Laodelphax striatellus]